VNTERAEWSELGRSKTRCCDREGIASLIASGQLEETWTLPTLHLHFMQPESGRA
jgi:hypothetical protein